MEKKWLEQLIILLNIFMGRNRFILFVWCVWLSLALSAQMSVSMNENWQFQRLSEKQHGVEIKNQGSDWSSQFNIQHIEGRNGNLAINPDTLRMEFDKLSNGQWENVRLPHTSFVEPLVVLNPWQDEGVGLNVYKDGEEIEAEVEANRLGDVYTFATEAGANYELRPSGELTGYINITEDETEVFIEDTIQLEVETNAEADRIVWESDDKSIALVEDGLVLPLRTGEVTITASIEGHEEAVDTCVVHVVNTKRLPAEALSASADSEENNGADGPGSYAVDGDESTFWHSGYSDGKTKPDIWNNVNNSITITLDDTYLISKVGYLPRQDDVENGTITKYEIWYSTEDEGEDFQKIAEGSWELSKEEQTAEVTPTECKRIRIRAMETFARESQNEWISAAEFYIYRTLEEPEEPSDEADKMSLNLVINMAEKLEAEQAETGCYTEETWTAVQTALDAARTLAADEKASQEDVDNAFLELITAVNLLENAVQRVALETAIEGARAILAEEEALADYTPESVENLRKVLADAEKVYAEESADQETVNAAARSLMDAVTSLVVIDKDTRLDILIQKAEELLADADQYTAASVENLQAALDEAKLTADDRDASEEQINAAYSTLAEAMTSMVRKADKSELQTALNKAAEILADTSKYVEESVAGLQAAADAAQAVYEKEDADAAEVGTAVKSLVDEILKARLVGDVDGNGAVDSADSAEVLKAAAEAQTLDEMQSLAADVNGDGEADSSDAAEILVYAAEGSTGF